MEDYILFHQLPKFPEVPIMSQRELETPFYARFLNNKKKKKH